MRENIIAKCVGLCLFELTRTHSMDSKRPRYFWILGLGFTIFANYADVDTREEQEDYTFTW